MKRHFEEVEEELRYRLLHMGSLTEEMIHLKSPGIGLKWIEKNKLIGKKAKKDIPIDNTLFENDFE